MQIPYLYWKRQLEGYDLSRTHWNKLKKTKLKDTTRKSRSEGKFELRLSADLCLENHALPNIHSYLATRELSGYMQFCPSVILIRVPNANAGTDKNDVNQCHSMYDSLAYRWVLKSTKLTALPKIIKSRPLWSWSGQYQNLQKMLTLYHSTSKITKCEMLYQKRKFVSRLLQKVFYSLNMSFITT